MERDLDGDTNKIAHSKSSTRIDIYDQPQPELDTFSSSSSSSSKSDDDEETLEVEEENTSLLHQEVIPTCLAHQLWQPFGNLVMNPLGTFFVFAIFNTIFILTWSFFSWVALMITRPGLFVLIIASGVALARFVALLIAYPGHLRIVTRDCERGYSRMCKRWLTHTVDTTDELLDMLHPFDVSNPARLAAILTLRENYRSCLQNIAAVMKRALESVEEEEGLSTDGQHILSRIRVYLKYADELNSQLFQLLSAQKPQASNFNSESSTFLTLISEFKACNQDLRDTIYLLGEKSTTPKRVGIARLICELWKARRPFPIVANLNLMRADLVARYNGKQVWIQSEDGHEIDGMFIPGVGLVNTSTNIERTVILCNPNCGLYEFHHFQSDWIQFYTKHGINVFVFNYRGYGRCKNYPSPHANNMDGMAIVKHLKFRGISRIAIHGESIGGMVATHVAKHSNDIELLIADRTFANLPAVAQRLVASWAGQALTWVTRWQTDNVGNYLEAKCHKLVCCDPCDEIVFDASSLKAGIALRLELGDSPDKSSLSPNSSMLLSCSSQRKPTKRSIHELTPGKPLTEDAIAKFTLSLQNISSRVDQIMASDGQLDRNFDDDEKKILDVWGAVASIDGHCGQTLFEAAVRGLEGIRTWIISYLVWGPSRTRNMLMLPQTKVEPRKLTKPRAIENVLESLQQILLEAPSLEHDKDVDFIIQLVEYLQKSLSMRLDDPHESNIGALIPLNCGHNANFTESEKDALRAYLVQFNWIQQQIIE